MSETALEPRIGQIIVPGEKESSLPLLSTVITGEITGPLAMITVTQQFSNPMTEPVELEYLIPLPHESAICKFEFQAGDRHISAQVRSRDQAAKEYERGMEEGFQAGLVEERRPNLFSIRLANVLPGQNITTTLQYQDQLKFIDDHWEFVYPMGITPRYDSPAHPEEGQGIHAPVALPGEPVGPVTIALNFNTGRACTDPTSPSHPLAVKRVNDHQFTVSLAGPAVPDHDFVLNIPVETNHPTLAAWQAVSGRESHILVSIIPPALKDFTPEPGPRHFLFVLDRSGSMSGEPIAQACNALRACLRTLNPLDTFNILLFDHEIDWYQPEPVAVNQAAIDAADAFLSQVSARGGTEILAALQAALREPVSSHKSRFILFLTDGAVSAETRVLKEVTQALNGIRIFTMGIGPSVNRYLLSEIAESGRGAADFLQSNEDIEEAILRFQDRVSFPVLTNLKIQSETAAINDCVPATLPDLYVGQPITLLARASTTKPISIKITGKSVTGDVDMDLVLEKITGREEIVSRAWASASIQKLMARVDLGESEKEIHSQALNLALRYSLITPLTSLVAVDDQRVTEGGLPSRINIAQPLPQNLTFGLKAKLARMPAYPVPGSAASIQFCSILPDFNSLQNASLVPDIADKTIERPLPDEKDLKWLVRTQMLNGSWKNDIESTAAALLAFFASGATPSTGFFRRQIQKALTWLNQNPGSTNTAWLRAYVIHTARRLSPNLAIQEIDLASLPLASTSVERIIELLLKGEPLPQTISARIDSLDGLRIAALAGIKGIDGVHRLPPTEIVELWKLVIDSLP